MACHWAKARQLTNENTQCFGLFMDHPLFTELSKCHYQVALTIEPSLELDPSSLPLNDVQLMEISAAQYACIPVGNSINQLLKDLTLFWKLWLPKSVYQIVHEPGIHLPRLDLQKHSFLINDFQLCVKVVPKQ